jgi:alkylmercury lyase
MTGKSLQDGLMEFDQAWLTALEQTPLVGLLAGLTGLTRLGERPAQLDRLAAIVGRSAAQTEELIRRDTTARIEDGLVYWDEPFPGDRTLRTLYISGREVPMKSGCAPDLFGIAAVLDVPFRVEDTCAATGVPIRIDFVPDGFERVDPPSAVTVLLGPGELQASISGTLEQINADVCTYQPFVASAEAAHDWLAAHPGGRVFTVEEMFERPWVSYYRHRLRQIIHPV